jgi:hypothetical protein
MTFTVIPAAAGSLAIVSRPARTAATLLMTDTLPTTEPRRAPMRVLSHVGGSV